jgi:uncharacterized protein DUF2569
LIPGGSTIDLRAFAQHDLLMQPHGTPDVAKLQQPAGQRGALPRIRGWLLVYTVVLVGLALHGAALTIASIVIYAHPAAAGLRSFVPLSFLLFYVITNVILILYTVVLLILMMQRRRSAILNNVIFNFLSVAFLVAWHFSGEKSNVGTLVDSVPGVVGAAYILLSRRVRSTFTRVAGTVTAEPDQAEG